MSRINVSSAQVLNDPTALYAATEQYLDEQNGELASVAADILGELPWASQALIVGWTKLPSPFRSNLSASASKALKSFPSDWPELEILPLALSVVPVNDTANYATYQVGLVAPLSRGNVTINSTDTADPPLINPNWLSDPTDQELAVQAFKALRLAISGMGINEAEISPGLMVQSDAAILAYIQQASITLYHVSATCECSPTCFAEAIRCDGKLLRPYVRSRDHRESPWGGVTAYRRCF